MTKTTGSRRIAGVVLLLSGVLLIVVPLALHAYSTRTGARPVGSAPPLTALELQFVHQSRSAVDALPKALSLVPTAMIDGAAAANPKAPALTEATVTSLLSQPDLAVLERAVQTPAPLATPLSRALAAADSSAHPARFPSFGLLLALFALPGLLALGAGAVVLSGSSRASDSGSSRASARGGRSARLAAVACLVAAAWLVVTSFLPVLPGGRSVWSNALRSRQVSHQLSVPVAPGGPAVSDPAAATTLQANLNLLQSVYADIVPAIQAAATNAGGTLSTPAAVKVIAGDPRLKPLQQLITGLSRIYGAGILSVQAAVAAQSEGHARQASTYLPVLTTLLALVLLGLAGWAGATSAGSLSRSRQPVPAARHRSAGVRGAQGRSARDRGARGRSGPAGGRSDWEAEPVTSTRLGRQW